MPGSRCKCHYQIIIPGHSFGPSPTSRLRELGHGIEVERQDLLSEVSLLAVISRIFLHLGDSIGILDAATDTKFLSLCFTHTHTGTFTHIGTHTHRHTHRHMHTHRHTHTCTYIHTCMLLLLLLLSRVSHVRLCATPEMAAHQAPPSL